MKTPPFGEAKLWKALVESFTQANSPSVFEQRLAQTLAHVKQWRWANDDAYNPTPFHREIFKAPALKWSAKDSGVVHHGLDAAGVVWIMRRWPSAIKENCGQWLIERQPGADDHFHYFGRWMEGDFSRPPQTVELKSLHRHRHRADGQIAASYSISDNGCVLNEYHYEGNRLQRSTFLSERPGKDFFTRREYQYAYDAVGGIKEITYEHYVMPEGRLVEKKAAYKQKLK